MPSTDSPRPEPETFVVRVCRRGSKGEGRIASTPKWVDSGKTRGSTARELQLILGCVAPPPAKPEIGDSP